MSITEDIFTHFATALPSMISPRRMVVLVKNRAVPYDTGTDLSCRFRALDSKGCLRERSIFKIGDQEVLKISTGVLRKTASPYGLIVSQKDVFLSLSYKKFVLARLNYLCSAKNKIESNLPPKVSCTHPIVDQYFPIKARVPGTTSVNSALPSHYSAPHRPLSAA